MDDPIKLVIDAYGATVSARRAERVDAARTELERLRRIERAARLIRDQLRTGEITEVGIEQALDEILGGA